MSVNLYLRVRSVSYELIPAQKHLLVIDLLLLFLAVYVDVQVRQTYIPFRVLLLKSNELRIMLVFCKYIVGSIEETVAGSPRKIFIN